MCFFKSDTWLGCSWQINRRGCKIKHSIGAKMNEMDRHIQQTNDRLSCIKQVC